jgi:hypothetical protein
MPDWWTAKCKKCDSDLAIRQSEAGPNRIDVGGLGSVTNPVECSVCKFKNDFAYDDLRLVPRKDNPTPLG